MIIYIDLDETLCATPKNRDYTKAIPIMENIKKANKLYNKGNKIYIWTARGSTTGIDYYELCKEQLADWGVKYHELKIGKPQFDLFIDDKAINTKDWK